MAHGGNSFDRLFSRANPSGAGGVDDDTPPVHELFKLAMQGELPMRGFEEALAELHGIRLSPAASRLLSSVDATSGRLSFAQFQRALHDSSGETITEAGKPNNFVDQASAIISDNCGAPVPGPTFAAPKVSTDISADPFVARKREIAKGQASGPFSDNPVVPTNKVSRDNPLAQHRQSHGPQDESREVGQTATRMFVAGELNRREYEEFLANNGIILSRDSELAKLVASHEAVGDGNFMQLSRALQRELAPEPATMGPRIGAHSATPAAGVARYG
mmetsp:Transcript_106990/g.300971  ORF Transcript_106990/g.300971 Transcript_106990/m.300971 type:complete len:275 (+) Transcript_106990:60-884(+)